MVGHIVQVGGHVCAVVDVLSRLPNCCCTSKYAVFVDHVMMLLNSSEDLILRQAVCCCVQVAKSEWTCNNSIASLLYC